MKRVMLHDLSEIWTESSHRTSASVGRTLVKPPKSVKVVEGENLDLRTTGNSGSVATVWDRQESDSAMSEDIRTLRAVINLAPGQFVTLEDKSRD